MKKIILYRPSPAMVPLVPCRSITAYIHRCPSYLQRHCAWISAVMFHSSRRMTSRQQCPLPPIVWQYCQFVCLQSAGDPSQFPAPAHNVLSSHVTSSIVLHRHSRFTDSVSKHYRSIFTALHGMQCRRGLAMRILTVCLSVRPSVCQTRAL